LAWAGPYNKGERENVGRLAQRSCGLCFGAPPHPITCLVSSHLHSRRDMCGVFKIRKLDSLDDYFVLVLFPVNQDVVRFDICLQ
jgi:hypothetical protein